MRNLRFVSSSSSHLKKFERIISEVSLRISCFIFQNEVSLEHIGWRIEVIQTIYETLFEKFWNYFIDVVGNPEIIVKTG